MAIEQRGNGSYYYIKIRIGDKVRSQYVGGGLVGELAAAADQEARAWLDAQQAAEREDWEAEQAIDRQLDELAREAQLVRDIVLLGSGYHRHKRQWRKRRGADGLNSEIASDVR